MSVGAWEMLKSWVLGRFLCPLPQAALISTSPGILVTPPWMPSNIYRVYLFDIVLFLVHDHGWVYPESDP